MSALPALPELQLIAANPQAAGMEGARMSFMQAGSGPETVLLLHGIGSNSTAWRYMFEALRADHRVVAWNAPGYYLTDHLRAEAPTNWQYADALAALFDALGIVSAHVAGSSFGSMVAATFAVRHPHRVRRLALLGASRGQKWLPPEERARRLALRDATAAEGAVAMSEKRWRVLLGPNADDTVIRLTREVLMATHSRPQAGRARQRLNRRLRIRRRHRSAHAGDHRQRRSSQPARPGPRDRRVYSAEPHRDTARHRPPAQARSTRRYRTPAA